MTALGSASEIANVNQVFHPAGRFSAANSAYPLRPKNPCLSPTGKMYPSCGPMPATRERKPPRTAGWPEVIGDLLVAISNQADKNYFDRKCDIPQSAWKSIPL